MGTKSGSVQANPNIDWFTNNTEAKSFTIHTAEDLAGLAQIVNGTNIKPHSFTRQTIILGEDIDLSAYASDEGWIPIGNSEKGTFSGTFDGSGHVISHLTINRRNDSYIGLFGYINKCGLVKNLGLCDVYIYGGNAVGSVVGRIVGSRILGVYSTGTIWGRMTDIGGIAGAVQLKSSVSSCYSTCEVVGKDAIAKNIGGIAGYVFQESSVLSCAALNTKVVADNTSTKTVESVGRVIGEVHDINTVLISNVAYVGMHTTANDTVGKWPARNGVDITAAQIQLDGTINGYFKTENGWTTQNGKLPGLGGKHVDLPEHLMA